MSRVQKITIAVLLVLAAILLFRFSDFLFIYPKAQEYFYDELGWSVAGARLGAFIVTAVLHSSQGAILLWFFFGAKKWEAMGVLAGIFVGQFVLSLIFTPKFGQSSGQSLRYWSKPIAGGCIQTHSSPGYDPQTGEQRRPVDREIARIINLCEKGILPRPIDVKQLRNRALFDPNSGDPIVYFSESTDGRTDLFDNPGFHPTLGTRLQPVTPARVQSLLSQLDSAARQEAAAAAEAQKRREQEEQERLAQAKLAYPPEISSMTFSPTNSKCDAPDTQTIDRTADVINICIRFDRARRTYPIIFRSTSERQSLFSSRDWIICQSTINPGSDSMWCWANRPDDNWRPGNYKIEVVIEGRVMSSRDLAIR